jgi:hypothetical protein
MTNELDKHKIIDEINKTIEQEMENLLNIAKREIGKLEARLKRKERMCDMWENIAVDNGEVALKYQQQLDKLRVERDSYIDKYFLESQKVINLKKVLTEIKETAERDKKFCDTCDGDREIDCVECIEGGRALLAQEILQKIGEV